MHVDAKNIDRISIDVAHSAIPSTDKSAFAAMVAQHRATLRDLNGKTVGEMITEERTYEMGVRMTRQARTEDAKHRSEMAELVSLTVPAHRDEDHRIVLTLRVQNKSAKAIRLFDTAIEVHAPSGTRVGITEFEVARTIAPHRTVTIVQPLTYVRFGEDAGAMRMAQGRPKTFQLDVKEIKYADGTGAGYGD